jgi:hypothetical protein
VSYARKVREIPGIHEISIAGHCRTWFYTSATDFLTGGSSLKRLLLSTLAVGTLICTALTGAASSYASESGPAGPAAASHVAATQAAGIPNAPTAPDGHHRAAAKDTTPPGPVTELAVSGNTLRSISLTWIDPADADLEHVLIRRAVGDQPPVSASDGVLVAVLNAHAAKFTDRKLASGTSYSYAVFTTDRKQNLSTVSTITALTLTTDDHTGIKGVLTDQQGYPIAGAWAEVRILGSGDFVGQATTGADGSYRVANIAAGTYTVCFEITPQTTGRSVTGYLPGCYRQQPIGYGDTGTPVTVTAGKMTTGIRDYLRPGGAISGRVTDPSGGGIGNVDVFVAYPYPQFYFYSTTSAADGSYTITGLPADDYQICFDATSATGPSDTGYLGECYDNEPPYAGGTSIPVSISQTTSGIDATLALGGAITGTVTDPAGNPVDDVLVSLIGPSGGNATTDAQGNYRITGVAAGNYTVCLDGSYAISATAPYGYTQSCQDTVRWPAPAVARCPVSG